MNQDFLDLLRSFGAHSVRFLVVGAYALAVHGRPRATGDLDVWIEASPDNADRVMAALRDFGAPLAGLSAADLSAPGVVYQIGVPPGRIDILTQLSGLSFTDAWPARVRAPFGPLEVDVIGREAFIQNKLATGRDKDRVDVQSLEPGRSDAPVE